MADNDIQSSPFGAGTAIPYVVAVQIQVRINAKSEQFAEQAVLGGISVGAKLLPHVVAIGAVAQPMTDELLRAMGVDPTKLTG